MLYFLPFLYLQASLLIQLQQAFRNSRRRSTPSAKDNKPRDLASVQEREVVAYDEQNEPVDGTAYTRMREEIKRNFKTTKVNDNVVGKLMQETYPLRRKWIRNEDFMSIKKVCEDFPALMYPKWVCTLVVLILYTSMQLSGSEYSFWWEYSLGEYSFFGGYSPKI